jgi:NAD(P)H dehydrogenase (quinone)
MVVIGLPYSCQGQMTPAEITRCSRYGAATIAGDDGSRPSDNEPAGVRFRGRHVAPISAKVSVGRRCA